MTENSTLSVLLADDDFHLRETLEEVLDRAGYRVYPAATGAEAIEIARTHPVDFGVLDFHMPDLTGVEVARQVSIMRRKQWPSILITSDRSEDVRRLTVSVGIYQVVHKPLDMDPFTRVLQDMARHFFSM